MDPITFDSCCYRIHGAPVHLYSGEFHYFRVPKADWRRRMELFREAGGNCLATYVPWLIHEPSEGEFVFGGPDGKHDLEDFLVTAREAGLWVIARPGPYQYSELVYDGLPRWLCDNYPQLRARNFQGNDFRRSSISYLHPLFLEKTAAWFDQVCPLLARHCVGRGGAIAAVQLDNEMAGIHRWFGGYDYNAETMQFGRENGRFAAFLRQRFGSVAEMNRLWGSDYASFGAARPPAPGDTSTTTALRRAKDYCDFYYGSIGEYSCRLAEMLRGRGIDAPLITNSPNPGSNLWFLETVQAVPPPFLLGSDHYYTLDQNWRQNNPTPQYAVEAFFSCETLRLLGYPPSVFELPGGSASDWPPVTPVDAKACYLANVALGMKGSNFYIYTGGPNIPGTGTTTDLYDYGAAVGAAGEVRPLYQSIKDVGLFLRNNAWLAEAELEAGCRFALDLEMLRTAEVWQAPGEFALSAATAAEFLRKGPLTTAFCAGLSPACCNLGADDWAADVTTPLVVVCASAMAADKQRRLIRFLEAGGKALLLPVLPTVDERFEPCTLLADYLGAAAGEKNANPAPRISVAGVVNILQNGQSFCWPALPVGADLIGVDEVSGSPVCWQRATCNGGRAIVLGSRYLHAMREHERLLAALLQRLDVAPRLQCSNPNVWCTLRTAGKRSALFAMNLYSAPMSCELRCQPAWSDRWLELGHYDLAAMEVRPLLLGA
jgi:beta-galactosidase